MGSGSAVEGSCLFLGNAPPRLPPSGPRWEEQEKDRSTKRASGVAAALESIVFFGSQIPFLSLSLPLLPFLTSVLCSPVARVSTETQNRRKSSESPACHPNGESRGGNEKRATKSSLATKSSSELRVCSCCAAWWLRPNGGCLFFFLFFFVAGLAWVGVWAANASVAVCGFAIQLLFHPSIPFHPFIPLMSFMKKKNALAAKANKVSPWNILFSVIFFLPNRYKNFFITMPPLYEP